MEHLVGAREAALRLGLVRVQALHHFRLRDGAFPTAVYWTTRGQGGTGVWYWPDVWRWAKASGHRSFANLGPLRKPSTSRPPARRIDIDDLVGSKQIADRLGVHFIQRVHVLREEDPLFPAPVFSSTGGRGGTSLWVWTDV
ncbi:MAG: hypothetical protein QOG43_1256, partial [Actinomycetota bacterium]|nr:hypothetical protein [Actinomycetota bacterium]